MKKSNIPIEKGQNCYLKIFALHQPTWQDPHYWYWPKLTTKVMEKAIGNQSVTVSKLVLNCPLWQLFGTLFSAKIPYENLVTSSSHVFYESWMYDFFLQNFMFYFLQGCKVSFSVTINSYIGIFDLNGKLLPCRKTKQR